MNVAQEQRLVRTWRRRGLSVLWVEAVLWVLSVLWVLWVLRVEAVGVCPAGAERAVMKASLSKHRKPANKHPHVTSPEPQQYLDLRYSADTRLTR